MTGFSIVATATALLAASNDEDLFEPGNDGHSTALARLAEAQAGMAAVLKAAGVDTAGLGRVAQTRPIVYFDGDGHEALSQTDFILRTMNNARPGAACFGRAVASGHDEQLIRWVESERERGTDLVEIVHAMMSLQTQITASVIGNLFPAGAFKAVADVWVSMISKRFVDHAGKIAAQVAQMRTGDAAANRSGTLRP